MCVGVLEARDSLWMNRLGLTEVYRARGCVAILDQDEEEEEGGSIFWAGGHNEHFCFYQLFVLF